MVSLLYKIYHGTKLYMDYICARLKSLSLTHRPINLLGHMLYEETNWCTKTFLLTFWLQRLRYERRSPNAMYSRASASGSAVETQPTIWTTWQHSPEDTFFIMAISSRKFSTSRPSAPPVKCVGGGHSRALHQKAKQKYILAVNLCVWNTQCIVHTFQKFHCNSVWLFPTCCLPCYVHLGWYCRNLHRECTFVHLAIVPFSQFGSNFEVRTDQFPLVTLGR